MKRILITGANSYIGTSFEKYIKEKYPKEYEIETLDMLDPKWRTYDFSKYDSVFHVAGIAHKKETLANAKLYYKINRDLAVEVAKKAKEEKVGQFIFMSSMSVYGLDYSNEFITLNTPTNPKTNYGKSKLEAEERILELSDTSFNVSILRPPMVYGINSPGNLSKLFNLVRKIHIFPTLKNERSAISIENLSEEVKEVVEQPETKIFLPQNKNYMCTYEIVKEKMKEEGILIIYTSFFNLVIKFCIGKVGLITKCFGNLCYELKE